jgi:hypothetical protein
MTTSRTIFGAALGLWAAVAAGCGSKPEPTAAPLTSEVKGDTPAPKGDTPPAPKGDAPTPPKGDTPAPAGGPVWEIDQTKHAVPDAPVKGRISGVDVTPEVLVSSLDVTFRVQKAGAPQPERAVTIKLAAPAGQPLASVAGRSWKVKEADAPGPNVPEIWQEVAGQPVMLHPNGYALTLELAPRKDGKVSGRVYLCLSDKDKSVLAGTFAADYFRFHTEPLGPDDVPYVTGGVTVTGAKPDAEVRVAYTGFASGTVLLKELQLGFDPKPEDMAQWQPDDADKPRFSRLIAGDGKARPFRYEHGRLTPGRYLLTAGVVGGPTAWKWVEVPADGKLTENFALDASQVGGIEVSVPADAKGKVTAAPADADRPPLAADQFMALALQGRLEADIVAGKAVLKNLAPGKYEVRAGDLRGFADVTAGKTAELVLMPPKK